MAAWTDSDAVETLSGARGCKQCQGDLLRFDEGGKPVLRCGTCGWPADRPLAPQPPLVVSADSQLAAARKRVAELEAELARVQTQGAPAAQGDGHAGKRKR